jgi:hypothetical protein
VDETVAKVTERGGKGLRAATDMPKVGRFAVIADPQGASISVFHPVRRHAGARPDEAGRVLLARAHHDRPRTVLLKWGSWPNAIALRAVLTRPWRS